MSDGVRVAGANSIHSPRGISHAAVASAATSTRRGGRPKPRAARPPSGVDTLSSRSLLGSRTRIQDSCQAFDVGVPSAVAQLDRLASGQPFENRVEAPKRMA